MKSTPWKGQYFDPIVLSVNNMFLYDLPVEYPKLGGIK